MKAAIIFGSPSDKGVMQDTAEVFRSFGIDFSFHVLSAHRTPDRLRRIVGDLEAEGTGVIVAGAGLAAHLPGVIASFTLIPVIGVPISAGALGGLDAILSMIQMPQPVPVAVVGLDNGTNAAYLACRILALKDPALQAALAADRAEKTIRFIEAGSLVDL